MQVRNRIKTAKPETEFDKTLEQELLSYSNELAETLNKGLKFSDNFNAQEFYVSSTGIAHSLNTLNHTLKRIPSKFVVQSIGGPGIIYTDVTATDTQFFFKCSFNNCSVSLLIY